MMKRISQLMLIAAALLLTACGHVNPANGTAQDCKITIPEFQTMQSSKIDGVKYVDGKLTIKFRSGAMQAFDSVPDRAVAGLVKAPAPFAYYKSFIKGRYPCHILMASNDRRMTEQSGMVTVRQHWMQ